LSSANSTYWERTLLKRKMAWDAIERLKLERVFSYKRFSEVRSPEQLQKQIERRIEEIYGRVD
jgi:hypothetical protein